MADSTTTDIQIKDLDNWKRGQISYFSNSRLQENALKIANNVIFDYDAIVRPRGGFDLSGIPDAPKGCAPLTCDFPFKYKDDRESLAQIFADGDNAHLYVLNKAHSEWKKFDTPFNKTKQFSLAQIANVIVIGNGIDKFTYYDIEKDEVKRFEKVADPTVAPTVKPVGFSGTPALDYYYRVAFNGVGGSTKMTPPNKISSSIIRDTWGSNGRSVSVDISGFTIDPNAKSWNVYVASVSTGTGAPTDTEYLKIAEGLPVDQKQFSDKGDATLLTSAPVENTTEGIKSGYFVNISGRLWAIGADNQTVYWGGDVGNELYFGSANGADSYSVNTGSTERPMAITLGRDNAGTTCINLLTHTIAGQGAIWDIYATTNTIKANDQTFSTGTYQFKKREGNDGTDAPFSVIRENNNAYYLSTEGFKSTGVKPNITGIQSTDIISSAIRDRVLNLSHSNLDKCYAAYYDEALYWTIAYGSQENNEIWMYDILHGGIWSIWQIPADCIFRWASTSQETPSLYIRQGNKLLRYYKNLHTHKDYSGVFSTRIESGLIPFANDRLTWVHLLKAVWQFDQAVGKITLEVNIHSKNGDIIKTNVLTFGDNNNNNNNNNSWDSIYIENDISQTAWNIREWGKIYNFYIQGQKIADKKISQKIRKNANYISFVVLSDTENTYFELSHLSLLFTFIGLGIEFLSQRGTIKI